MDKEPINPQNFNKIGFVASGGAAKALFYHIGVTLALKERGIEFRQFEVNCTNKSYIDLVVGSSGGSIFAALVSNGFSEQTIEKKLETKEWWSYIINPRKRNKGDLTGFSYADIFMLNLPNREDWQKILKRIKSGIGEVIDRGILNISFENLFKNATAACDGLFKLDRLEKYLEDVLVRNDFKKLKIEKQIELYIIGTELKNPRKAIFGPQKSNWINTDEDDFYRDRYLDDVSISKAVAASCAVPGLFKPVNINGVNYVDGETKKTLSTHVATDNGCDLVIVSHTFTPHLEVEGDDPEFGLFNIIHQAFQILMYQKIQTSREFHTQKKLMFEHFASKKFRDKIKITKEQQEMILEDFEKYGNFRRNRRYIFIPSPPETFHLDYFNIFPPMLNELINTGYATANRVLDLQSVPKLPDYETIGILNNLGVARKKFKLISKYKRAKQKMMIYHPNFFDYLQGA